MPVRARRFVYAYITIGLAAMGLVFAHWRSDDTARFLILLVLGVFGSQIKFKIPRVQGAVTAGMIVVLISIVELSVSEAMVIGLIGTATQSLWRSQAKPTALQFLFNFASFGVSIGVTANVYDFLLTACPFLSDPVILIVTGVLYCCLNTGPVAVVISLVEKAESPNWRVQYGWMALFYASASCLAGALHLMTTTYGWQAEFLVLPILLMTGRTYQVFLGRIEDGQRHSDEVLALQFRSIHTLALAVEAKDENTNAHLHRVRSYAGALGRELGLTGEALQALDAAAILHDIGKLAVPEHIIAKPGKLTPEEFDRMKIHTVVGAAIVEEMQFPYPVAPLVRGHHEKWDGNGYPDGLAGEAIPLGARILAAVDCLDALASTRPYRRAMPLEKAMEIVRSESGKAYDPRIVEVLGRNYVALEAAARASLGDTRSAITANVHVTRGNAPATGFEISAAPASPSPKTDPIAKLQAALSAQTAVAALAAASQGVSATALASSLSALVGGVVPHDTLVLFKLSADDHLVAVGVHGVDADLLSRLSVPLRRGLAGWVAHHRESIVNGDPAVEIGADLWERSSDLRSALAVPLHLANRTVGVVGLYRRDKDSFNRSELGMLDLLTPQLSECLAEAAKQPGSPSGDELLKQLVERAAGQDEAPILLFRLELEGGPSPQAAQGSCQVIRESLATGAIFLELRPNQLVVLSKRSSGGIAERLEAAAQQVLTQYGVRVAIGGALFESGSSLEAVVAEAERALAQSKLNGGLLGLHAATTRNAGQAPARTSIRASTK